MGLWLVGCSAYKAPCKSLAHPWIRVSYDSNVVDSTQLPFCLTCIDCACCSHITVLSLQPASTECKHSGVASYVARLGNNFIFSSLWSKSDSQLSKYCVVCEIYNCQQLAALSISTALLTKLLVIEQLLQLVLKSTVSAHDIISSFAPPRNKSWQRHCVNIIRVLARHCQPVMQPSDTRIRSYVIRYSVT